MSVILLHSAGMDSHVAFLMHPDWQPVYVAHGAENEATELRALQKLAELDRRFKPVIINAVQMPARFDGHVFFRNLVLLSSALAAFPDSEAVAFGALLGEGSGDKSAAFCRHLMRAWKSSEGHKVRLLRPLRHMTKSMALRRGLKLTGGQFLNHTTSCYHGNRCGKCQSCFRLGIAQYLCGLRIEPPALPTETLGVRATLAAAPMTRWPAMALANVDVVRAFAQFRLRRAWG